MGILSDRSYTSVLKQPIPDTGDISKARRREFRTVFGRTKRDFGQGKVDLLQT